MESLLKDLRYGARRLRRSPLATSLAVLTLGLGIGLNTAVLSVVDAVLLRPLPVLEEERLVKLVKTRSERGGHYSVDDATYHQWRQRQRAFRELAAMRGETVTLGGEEPERLAATRVSAGYFEVLGISPALGRAFLAGEPAAEGADVVVLGDRLWRRRFGADPEVLGRSVELDGRPHRVVGVMPPGAESPPLGWRDLWLPSSLDAAAPSGSRGYSVLGRLRDAVTLEVARRDLAAVSLAMAREAPESHAGWEVEMHPVRWWLVGEVERSLLLVYGAATLVLLVACANVAGLLLGRSAARRREMAVRKALGASRRRLLRQLMAESALLAASGGAAGLALAWAGVRLLSAFAALELPRLGEVAIDLRMLGAALVLTLLAGLASGLLPAVGLARVGAAAHGRGSLGGGRGAGRWQRLLVAAQTAVALLVLIAAVLLARSFSQLSSVALGFDAERVLTLRLDLPAERFPEAADRAAFSRRLVAAVEAVPGVERAAINGQRLPLTGGHGTFMFFAEGHPRGEGRESIANAQMVSPGYLRAMGIRLLRGRDFEPGETWESAQAVLVNETFGRRYWPGEEAVGKRLEFMDGSVGEVVGVIGDVRQMALNHEVNTEVYVALGHEALRQALVVRAAGDPAGLVEAVRSAVREVAPDLPIYDLATGADLVGRSTAERRFATRLVGLFALLALALGLVGTYAVIAVDVARRRREIGLRMALGATPGDVLRRSVARGMVPVLAGLAAGAALALATADLLEGALYGISVRDPAVFLAGPLCFALAALLAGALPSRRAARLDPAETLRRE